MQKGLKIERNKVTLYDTVVLEVLATKVIRVKTGGWVTMSTRKAINTGLAAMGIQGMRAFIKKGVLYVSYIGDVSLPVNGERVFNLVA